MSFQLQAYLTGFGSKTDGGASIRFATNEISDQDFAELKKNLNSFGYLLFKENAFSESDIPKGHAEDKNKTPSKRLRSVLYLYSKQLGEEDFEKFYNLEVEKIITHYKNKLD